MKTLVTLLLSGPLSSKRSANALRKRLPAMQGRAIRVRFLPELTAGSRKLYSCRIYGQPVYAGTLIRKRRIVLDLELASKPNELRRILIHELFHFAWVRLSNETRRSYEDLLQLESTQRARGELGWSAESRKSALLKTRAPHHKRWRDYACESFCDTAAWLYSEIGRHSEFTLAPRHRRRRAEWFQRTFHNRPIPI